MSFELDTLTKAKLLDVVVLSQKNRQPDENPGAKLTVELSLSNHALSQFDGHLKSFLFAKNGGEDSKAKQATLDGVDVVSDMPNLSSIGAKIGALRWSHELTGYELVVDLGLGTKRSNLEIEGCTLSGWKITPKEGGSVLVKVNIESPDVSEAAFGKLAKLKSREIQILLTAPEVEQDDLVDDAPAAKASSGKGKGDNWPFPKQRPASPAEKSATDEFLSHHGAEVPQ